MLGQAIIPSKRVLMEKLLVNNKLYSLYRFENEAEFERVIVKNVKDLFGPRRLYLDTKRRIGAKGKKNSVPDGYLFDFSRQRDPRLYVVENELAAHDPFTNIGPQILQFSFSFESDKQRIVKMLLDEIKSKPDLKQPMESFLPEMGLENLDALISTLVYDKPFQAVVVIDELSDDLIKVLEKFSFPVERIEFKAFWGRQDEFIYKFEPFLSDVEDSFQENVTGRKPDISELDTIVVPALEDGFKETFLGEQRWYAIRVSASMIPQIKFISAYQTAPVKAITYMAPVRSIEQWKGSNKYVVNFAGPAKRIGPLRLVKDGKTKPLMGPRYASSKKLKAAKNLDEAF
jgi:hypothetical protein